MPNIDIKIIENYMKEKGLTKAEFCESCGISLSCLNKVLCGDKNIQTKTLRKLIKTLKVKADDLLMINKN